MLLKECVIHLFITLCILDLAAVKGNSSVGVLTYITNSRSKSKSPPRKRRASNSPHRAHRHSPPSFRSHHRVSVSPSNSAGRYGSSPFSSKYSRSPPPSPRSSRYSRRSPSPPSRYPSPTPSRNRHRDASPEVARKHKHKHRY